MKRYYTPGAITLATFFGTPLVGFYLVRINALLADDIDEARRDRRRGWFWFVVLMSLAMLLPEDFPGLALSLPSIIAMHRYARIRSWRYSEAFSGDEFQPASMWKAAGIGLLFCVVIFAVVLGAALGLDYFFPPEETDFLDQ